MIYIISSIILLILICATILIYYYYTQYNSIKNSMSFKETIALTELPIVTFQYKNKKLNLLLDTCSNNNVIDERVANILKLKKSNKVASITGLGGTVEKVFYSDPVKIKYNNIMFDTTFQITDMGEPFYAIKKNTGATIHGIIGSNFMLQYKYIIDFEKMVAYSKKR